MKITAKKLALAMFIAGVVFVIGGILLWALAVPAASSTFFTVVLVALSLVLILMGVVSLFGAYEGRETDSHFFRYDEETGRNIDLDQLTFAKINDKLGEYVGDLAPNEQELWTGNIFERTDVKHFGVREVCRPLLAYKMLYDLAVEDKEESWALFADADPELIDSMADALQAAGEDAMPRTLIRAYNNITSAEDVEWVRDFIKGNTRYLKRRIQEYTKRNDALFY